MRQNFSLFLVKFKKLGFSAPLRTEIYNNEQVPKVFRKNFNWNVPKNWLFW